MQAATPPSPAGSATPRSVLALVCALAVYAGSVALLDGVFMRIGLSLLLGLGVGLGVYGFWYGDALASFTPFAIGGIYFLTGRWRTRKYIIKS